MSRAQIEIGGFNIGQKPTEKTSRSNNKLAFHALILANLTGHNPSKTVSRPKIIDRDNFDELLSTMHPTLSLCFTDDNSQTINLTFRELEDFEPDNIYDSVEAFADLRTMRRKLSNNSTFESAANEMKSWATVEKKLSTENTVEVASAETKVSIGENDSLLDFVISETDNRLDNDQRPDNLAQTLIQKIVAPYIVPASHPMQQDFIKTIDKSISDLMRLILHHEDFKSLESTWRSLYLCVRKIPTDSKLKLFVYDISKNTLAENVDLEDITQSSFIQQAIEPNISIAGAVPWSLIVGDYNFHNSDDDIHLLNMMGAVAQQCNATFAASASSTIIGCDNFGSKTTIDDWTDELPPNQQWENLRNSDQASHIALCIPRTMVRLPYGEKSRSVENFEFEELEISDHNAYLWGNSAYHLLILMAKSYEENGWNFKPGQENEITDLPAHYYDVDGEAEMKACAEIYLNERGAEHFINHGLLPIWSILRGNAARIGPFFSLHKKNQLISGRWNN